jgi:hypothetical protein
MPLFSVMFTVEADTLAEVEGAVGSWVVTPGTTLTSITGTVFSQAAPLTIADGGEVSSGTKLEAPPNMPPETQADVPMPEPEPEGKSK